MRYQGRIPAPSGGHPRRYQCYPKSVSRRFYRSWQFVYNIALPTAFASQSSQSLRSSSLQSMEYYFLVVRCAILVLSLSFSRSDPPSHNRFMCSCHKLLLYININNNPRSFHTVQALYDLPDYFEENGYKSPDDGYDGSFQYARATNLTVFEYLATKPKFQQALKTQ